MRKRISAVLLAMALCLSVFSTAVSAASIEDSAPTEDSIGETWDISKSKTATNLDENFESKVTLSLPSAEEELVTDVVFVLDESSCSEPVKEEVSKMLEELYKQVSETNATIKIGAVQFRGEVTEFPLTVLTEDTKGEVTDFMSQRPTVGGSNMSAGIIAGEAMLDSDDTVSADRKYLILVSDGITYIWDDEETPEQENYGVNYANSDTPNNPMLAGPDAWDVKHGQKYVPDVWGKELEAIGKLVDKTIKEKASIYVRGADISGNPFVSYSEVDEYVSTVDVALYKSYQVYTRVASKYSHTYVVMAGVESEMDVFPFGPSFMNYMGGENSVSFSEIMKDIIYLVDAGSYVEDYMGYVDGDYDFDFVNDAAALSLQVGDTKYEAVPIDENTYGFAPMESNDSAPYYAYKVTYIKGTQPDEEHFVWDIYVPVTNFEPVQLTYTVKLTNPKTAPGTYGTYDVDGSQEYEGLFTNNTAILTPVDTNGRQGAPEIFNKPTVSYTVAAPEESSVPEKPETHENVQTGDDSSLGLYTAIMIGCIGMLSLGLYARQKKQREEN